MEENPRVSGEEGTKRIRYRMLDAAEKHMGTCNMKLPFASQDMGVSWRGPDMRLIRINALMKYALRRLMRYQVLHHIT